MWPIFDACVAGVKKVEAELGPVDVIVNNAGITRDATMKKMNRKAWDEVLDTNLGGCYNMCKAAWDGMLARGFGRIVNIGSINGQAGQYGQVNYAAAKSGIHGFTKALGQEGARQGHHRQRHRARLYRHRHGGGGAGGSAGQDRGPHSGGPAGQGGGDRARRAVSGGRRRRIYHRIDLSINGGQHMY